MLDSLTQFVTVLLALSIASERLVELFKGIFPTLNGPQPDKDTERKRQLKVHWMSLVASVIVVLLAQGYIVSALQLKDNTGQSMSGLSVPLIATYSILASGGSSMWNSILTYLLSLKNLKQQQATDGQTTQLQKTVDNAKAGNADLTTALPASMPNV